MTERVRASRQVAQVRSLQRLAAEAAVQRAAADHADYARRVEACRAELAAQEGAWTACQTADRLDLDLSRALAGAIWRAQSVADLAEGDRAWAARREREAREAWRGAIICADAAEERLRDAVRNAGRRREEAALAEATDRRGRRGGSHEG